MKPYILDIDMHNTLNLNSQNFAQALALTSDTNRFVSVSVHDDLLKIGLISLAIPFLSVFALAHVFTQTTSLSSNAKLTASSTYSLSSQFHDELSLANRFLSQANSMGSKPQDQTNFLNEAIGLLHQVLSNDPMNTQALSMNNQASQLLASIQSSTTQIAASAALPINSQVVGSSISSNSKQGTVILKIGSDSLWVSYPQLKDNTQLYLVRQTTGDNSILYIQNRIAGKGFTLASSSPVTKDIIVKWYEIKPVNK